MVNAASSVGVVLSISVSWTSGADECGCVAILAYDVTVSSKDTRSSSYWRNFFLLSRISLCTRWYSSSSSISRDSLYAFCIFFNTSLTSAFNSPRYWVELSLVNRVTLSEFGFITRASIIPFAQESSFCINRTLSNADSRFSTLTLSE